MGRSQVLYNRTKGRYKERGGRGRGRGGGRGDGDGDVGGRGSASNNKNNRQNNNNNNRSPIRQRAPYPESSVPLTKQQQHKENQHDHQPQQQHHFRKSKIVDESILMAHPPTKLPQDYGRRGSDQLLMDDPAAEDNTYNGVARVTELDMRLLASTLSGMEPWKRLRMPRHLVEPVVETSRRTGVEQQKQRKNQSALAAAPSTDSAFESKGDEASSIQSDLIRSPPLSPAESTSSPSKIQAKNQNVLSPYSEKGAEGEAGVEDHFWKNFSEQFRSTAAAMNPFATKNNDDTAHGGGQPYHDDDASFSVGTRTRAHVLPDGAVEVQSKPRKQMISNLETVAQEIDGTSSSLSNSKEETAKSKSQSQEGQHDGKDNVPASASNVSASIETSERTGSDKNTKSTSAFGGDDGSIPFTLPNSKTKKMAQEDLTIPRSKINDHDGEAGSIPFTLPNVPSREESSVIEGGKYFDEEEIEHKRVERPSGDKYLVNMMDELANGKGPVIGLDKYLNESNSSASGYHTAQENLLYGDDPGDKMIVQNRRLRNPKDYFPKAPTFHSREDDEGSDYGDDDDDEPSYATPLGVIKNKYAVPRVDKATKASSDSDEDLESWLDATMNDNNNSKRSDIKNIKSLPTSMGEEVQLVEQDGYYHQDSIMVGSDPPGNRTAAGNRMGHSGRPGPTISSSGSSATSTASNTNTETRGGLTYISETTTSTSTGSGSTSLSYTTDSPSAVINMGRHAGTEGIKPAFDGTDSVSTLSRSTLYPQSRASAKPDPPIRPKPRGSSTPSPRQSRPITTKATQLQPQRQPHVITSTLLPSAAESKKATAPPMPTVKKNPTNNSSNTAQAAAAGGCWPGGGRGTLFGGGTNKATPPSNHPFDPIVEKRRGLMAGGLPTTKELQPQKHQQQTKKKSKGDDEDLEDWLDSMIT